MRSHRRRYPGVAGFFAISMNAFLNAVVLLVLVAVAVGIGYVVGTRRVRAARPTATRDVVRPNLDIAAPTAPASAATVVSREPHRCASRAHARALDDDRAALFRALADARTETARYRQVVVDIERNAPPPLLDAPGTPDDLKLVVGIGPAIERLLHQIGIGTYRQIARLTERDIDAIEAKLAEFPGRVRRDGWVTQARALHAAKYGRDS
jgi:predicted flap endonuclease-1-like 5' DNA nuclease